jgi:isochorismate pyruvate lyase
MVLSKISHLTRCSAWENVALICKNGGCNNPGKGNIAMHNDAPTVPPEACGSMAQLRDSIDALDRRLVALLAERQRYIERAAVLKSDRGAVRDHARIEEVVANVVEQGRAVGLSPAIAAPVWRTFIEASIAHEFAAFDRRQAGGT